MKAGYVGNTPLQMRAAMGGDALRVIPEIVESLAADVRDTPEEWILADAGSLSGVDVLDDGGVRISGVSAVHASQLLGAANALTNMAGLLADAVSVATVEWLGTGVESRELHTLVARLNPNTGGGKQVSQWRARLFRLESVEQREFTTGGQIFTIIPISGVVSVVAGTVTEDVSFGFAAGSRVPVVGQAPTSNLPPDAPNAMPRPTTVIVLWAVKTDGTIAGNVSWVGDNGLTQAASGTHNVSRFDLSKLADQSGTEFGFRFVSDGRALGLPWLELRGKTFTEKTISFTTNPIDIGAAPQVDTDLVVVLQGDQPGGSMISGELDVGGGFVTVQDGDKVGKDNTPSGGSDLSGLTRDQIIDGRVILTPNAGGDVTPIARKFGLEEQRGTVLLNAPPVPVTNYSTSATTRKSNIPKKVIELVRDGVKDYRDFATTLISENFIGAYFVRFWWGHQDLDRKNWMHLDDFEVQRTAPEPGTPPVKLELVTATHRLGREIPVPDPGTGDVDPLVYKDQSLKAVGDDLVVGQIGVPGRLVGPLIADDTTLVSKEILQKTSGKGQLDQVSKHAGGVISSSQGRLKFFELFKDGAPVHVFGRGQARIRSISPNEDQRIVDFSVPFGWNPELEDGKGAFQGHARSTETNALANLGRALIGKSETMVEDEAKWVPRDGGTDTAPTSTLADLLSLREVTAFGSGVALITFDVLIPQAQLEFGDIVAVWTEDYIAKDPLTARALKGQLWASGPIVQFADDGSAFQVWIRAVGDSIPSVSQAVIGGLTAKNPTVDVVNTASSAGDETFTVTAIKGVGGGPTLTVRWRLRDENGVWSAPSLWFPSPLVGLVINRHATRILTLEVVARDESKGGIESEPVQVQISDQKPWVAFDGDPLRDKEFDDGGYTVVSPDTDGLRVDALVDEAGGKRINRLFAKPLAGDLDDADAIVNGLARRITTLDEATGASRAAASFTGDNKLDPMTGIDEGGALQKIARNLQWGTVNGPDADGVKDVVFPAPFQAAPAVTFADLQLIMFNSLLGTAVSHVLRLVAQNVTRFGFQLVAQNVNPGATTAQTDEFVAGNSLTAVDETVGVNLDPGGANDNTYTSHYEVHVTALDLSVGGSVSIVVAIETDDGGGGGFVERATFPYSAVAVAGGGSVTNDWNHEQKAIVVSGLGLNDDVQLIVKSVNKTGAGGSFNVHGFNKATDLDASEGLTYNTAADTTESAIKDAAHSVKWIAQEAA